MHTSLRLLPALLFLIAVTACGSSSTSQAPATATSPEPAIPTLSDGAVIWCDDNRWQVVVFSAQLGLDEPPTNPAQDPWLAEMSQRVDNIDAAAPLARAQLEAAEAELNVNMARYNSGEWHESGVIDSDWLAFIADSKAAYARSCAAAYELRE